MRKVAGVFHGSMLSDECCFVVAVCCMLLLEELREGAVSQGVEWLRSALSEISKNELRALAATTGPKVAHCNRAARRVGESLGVMKGGWVRQKWVLTKLVFLIEVECSSHGAIL